MKVIKQFGCVPKEKAAVLAWNMIQLEKGTGLWWKDATESQKTIMRHNVDLIVSEQGTAEMNQPGLLRQVVRAYLEI